jgi:signal transduction histidine kinase
LSTFRHIRLWWAFGILIAIPALGLVAVGLRAAWLEDSEREHQRLEQERQTAAIADTLIKAALSRLDAAASNPAVKTDPDTFRWSLKPDGDFYFPDDRIESAGRILNSVRNSVPEDLQAQAEEALAAESQGRYSQSEAVFRRFVRTRELGVWAQWSLTRNHGRINSEAFLSWIRSLKPEDRDALSPDGTPVMLLAGISTEQLPPNARAEAASFVSSVRDDLYSGRWWLSDSERRVNGENLQKLVGNSNTKDERLAGTSVIAQLLRDVAPFRKDEPTYSILSAGGALVLLTAHPNVGPSAGWTGTAISGAAFSKFFLETLRNLHTTPNMIAIADSNKHVAWGEASATEHGQRLALQSLSGWTVWVASSADPSSAAAARWRWYGMLAVLLSMIAFGLFSTARLVRREMELSRLQSEFAAGVTHEFKSPITGIQLLVERISRGHVVDPVNLRGYCSAILKETDHLHSLVNRLLETHRLQSGQKSYHLAPHSMTDIAESAIARLRPHAQAKRITVNLHSDDPAREIDVDRTAMADAIENLLENGIKYSSPDTVVTIRIRHEGKMLEISVSDQGIGIDKTDLSKIFEYFYRGRRGQEQAINGTGLGLALVKAAAEGHRGSVEVTSEVGKGSEFCMRLPISQEESYVPRSDY